MYRNNEVSTLDTVMITGEEQASVLDVIARRSTKKYKAYGHSPVTGFNAVFKRLFDIVFSILVILALSPVLVAIGLLVKLSSQGPVIFKQSRHGLNGEEIKVWKFRSMVISDNDRLVRQATRNDARVTKIGKILRKTSLDELPQFFNVLQGSMSVVGPRPHAVAHNRYYRGKIKHYMRRHVVKPGITGWAQVNGSRGETQTIDKMRRRIKLDLDYIKNWTPWLDFYIIGITMYKGFSDNNAY